MGQRCSKTGSTGTGSCNPWYDFDLHSRILRIEKAAQADFVICLYNPRSKGRPDYLKEACERIMKYRPPETVCGVASSIGRDGEEMKVMSLKELADYPADMFTTVFIGKSSTVKIGRWMVTPRGYMQKKEK